MPGPITNLMWINLKDGEIKKTKAEKNWKKPSNSIFA